MAVANKGKVPTKGSKQIIRENVATVNFYRNMSIGAGLFYNLVTAICYVYNLSSLVIIMNLFTISVYVGCYQMMKYISRPRYSDNSVIADPGLDLNMEGGMGEHVKDVVILASITHILAVFSSYFWLLLLLLPIRAFYLLWTHILGPWFFQAAPEDTEQDEKKRKKIERRMNRFK